jgi:hypothetical protein
MTITKPCPKEVERRAQAQYELDTLKHRYPQIAWSRRCETVRNAYRDAATRAIAQESME